MRRMLAFTTTLAGAAGALGATGSAQAADGIKLAVGGFFNEAYQVVIDDNGKGDAGHDHNTDGFFNDAEVHFSGETALDNGLEVGAHIELEGETGEDQIDQAYVHFSGGFGELRVGSDDEALANMCVVPPGGSSNFSAFSPNQWAANTLSPLGSNPVCLGVDDKGSAQKLVYYTPVFNGFQLGLSYTPAGGRQSHTDGVGPHVGMPGQGFDTDGDGIVDTTESRHNVSAYGTYAYEGDGWDLTLGAGGSWTGQMEEVPGNADANRSVYQTGVALGVGDISLGAAFEYFDNYASVSGVDGFVAGAGIAYDMDPWTFGLQYSYSNLDIALADAADSTHFFDSGDNFVMNRAVATAEYELGRGINLDGELGYTWSDADTRNSDLSQADGYEAFEIGIGTAITF